jgi:hypothetical protein
MKKFAESAISSCALFCSNLKRLNQRRECRRIYQGETASTKLRGENRSAGADGWIIFN